MKQIRQEDIYPDDVSLSKWTPELSGASPGTGNAQSIIDLFEKNEIEQSPDPTREDFRDSSKGFMESGNTAMGSMQAGGGLGGALTSGGTMMGLGSLGAAAGTPLAAAGPIGLGLLAAGLILSSAEKKKQESAKREQMAIDNEMQRRNRMIDAANRASGTQFRLA
jgi:hypothetical protein